MTWFDVVGGNAFKNWLIETADTSRIRQGSKLDPFASSMRKFHNAHGWLNEILDNKPSTASTDRAASQRIIDLKSAGLLSSESELSTLGVQTLKRWTEKKLKPNQEDYEIPRCLILLQEATDLNRPDYLQFISFWREVRKVFSFNFIISHFELLYFVSYLDKTHSNFNPWYVISYLELGDEYFQHGIDWRAIKSFYGEEVERAIDTYQKTLDGYASREGRSSFCTAIELLTGASSLEEVLDVSELPKHIEDLIRELVNQNPNITSPLFPSQPLPDLPRNRILYGPPGSGKSYRIDETYANGHAQIRVTFHPDSDYNSFVGSYKPVSDADGNIHYNFVPQAFTNAYLSAWSQPKRTVFLIIEEINRGNCAQVFGDLFQSLDRNERDFSVYPVDADTDLANYLRKEFRENPVAADRFAHVAGGYKNVGATDFHKLILPDNLFIYATMNTSDQSLFPMDSAFKRRWDWEYIPIDYTDANRFVIQLDNGLRYSWADFIRVVNQRIYTLNQSEDKQLGNRFVNPADGIITQEVFKSKVLFYLWSEIYKNETEYPESLFRIQSDSAKMDTVAFTFSELFEKDENGEDKDKTILPSFMRQLGLEPIPIP